MKPIEYSYSVISFVFTSLILLCFLSANAQVELGKVKINAKNARLLQTFLMGDSILYSFHESELEVDHNRMGWLVNGISTELYVPSEDKMLILDIARKGPLDCMYFAVGKGNDKLLRVLSYDKSRNYLPEITDICMVSGKLAGTYSNRDLVYFITMSKQLDYITCYKISGRQKVDEKIYKVPEAFKRLFLNSSTVEFYKNNTFYNNSPGAYPRKFIMEGTTLYFLGDMERHKGTLILEFDLEKGTMKETILEHREDWNTFLCAGYLYVLAGKKIEKDRLVNLKVLEPGSYKEIFNSVFMTRDLPKNVGYFRIGETNQTIRAESYNPNFGGGTSILVSPGTDYNTVRIGTYFQNPNPVFLNAANPATLLASISVAALQNQVANYSYWYLREKKDHSSIFLQNPPDPIGNGLQQRIDEIEMSAIKDDDVKQIFYAGKNGRIIATYYYRKELKFLKYE